MNIEETQNVFHLLLIIQMILLIGFLHEIEISN